MGIGLLENRKTNVGYENIYIMSFFKIKILIVCKLSK